MLVPTHLIVYRPSIPSRMNESHLLVWLIIWFNIIRINRTSMQLFNGWLKCILFECFNWLHVDKLMHGSIYPASMWLDYRTTPRVCLRRSLLHRSSNLQQSSSLFDHQRPTTFSIKHHFDISTTHYSTASNTTNIVGFQLTSSPASNTIVFNSTNLA